MNLINRRKFLILSGGVTGSVLLTHCQTSPALLLPIEQTTAISSTTSNNGLLEVALEARSSLINLGRQQAHLMTYNGSIPGPRLEAKPGDRVRIRFTNKLSEPTNLHYHGLHIPPMENADNIFLSVPPNETLTYEFTLPQNHPAGTFYYHPHLHEFVAEQVFGGLGGIFVVRGELDKIPEIEAAKEEFLFIKDFAVDANGQISTPGHMDLMQGREGNILTVNGQVNPNFSLVAGGLSRLRIVNASTSRFYRLQLENHPFFLIATDGGAITEPVELPELLLSPGERAEVLVQGNRSPGEYRLLSLPYDRGGMGMMGGGMMGSGMMGGMYHGNSRGSTQAPQVIATVTYQGANPTTLPLPQTLLPVQSLPQPITTRRIEMSMSMGMGRGMGMQMAFLFNGQVFDMNRVDAEVKLGTVEDWELVNVDPDGMEHSFHLHTNPFQVVSRNGQPDAYRAWEDTLRVRANETVRIRIPFLDYLGKTVYHCHVLDHEDLGMMGIVEIQK
ncbi:Blue copper oxidase CueO [Planktothrix tepida]|uniref:Multicopper oxidase type 3 n=1 Tax=Planktothrix tepida PCC 9214 TaxID=671072 RepID=A0A1J1LLG0_9CYAN|nr:multicopper oxidase family protein [Planktothrix tepida]CAD5946731.1 Blue copper oxidase CueO [Planktothrix tepida]CUR32449.1 Multicopper oxidase type 3 [Planktothrix tepida PCC 9214]